MEQNEENSYLLEGAVRNKGEEVFSLFCELCLFLNFFRFDFFFLLLEVVFGFRLWHFDGVFLGGGSGWWWFFFGSSSFVCWIFQFDKGYIVFDHFLAHFLRLLSLFIYPLSLLYNYIVGSVVQFAVVPDQLDVRKTTLHCFIVVVVQVAAHCSQVHGSFDNHGVVEYSKGNVVNGLSKVEGIL